MVSRQNHRRSVDLDQTVELLSACCLHEWIDWMLPMPNRTRKKSHLASHMVDKHDKVSKITACAGGGAASNHRLEALTIDDVDWRSFPFIAFYNLTSVNATMRVVLALVLAATIVSAIERDESWGAPGWTCADRAHGALTSRGIPDEYANKAVNFGRNQASAVGGRAGARLSAAYDRSKARNGKFARAVDAGRSNKGEDLRHKRGHNSNDQYDKSKVVTGKLAKAVDTTAEAKTTAKNAAKAAMTTVKNPVKGAVNRFVKKTS
ncbi:unnamed protein product [Aphanomyces euteiches]